MNNQQSEEAEEGPFAYVNWRRAAQGEAPRATYEFPLYTDGLVTGEQADGGLDLGPYAFVNTVPIDHKLGLLRPGVVLRIRDHFPPGVVIPDMSTTDVTRYHGGHIEDEIAALASLCLGLRFWPGAQTREFRMPGDPLGRPRAEPVSEVPTIVVRKPAPMIPSVGGPSELDRLHPLTCFPALTSSQAIALIRAARAYQLALWLADSEPNLSWLLFVSAVEAAATSWFVGDLDSAALLRENKSEFAKRLTAAAGEEAFRIVADEFGPTMKATAKFIEFVMTFLPPPPDERPHESAQHEWSTTALKRSVQRIYKYRSRALHEGLPFPAPMCEHPFLHADWDAHAETPTGHATSALGGVWTHDDTPMHLHVFEYIVRRSLISWLDSRGGPRSDAV